jgi:pimeloyl-ACP methyl ester carboxylesterase
VIKLTYVPSSKNADAPVLLLIPGGPGLSSLTLRSLEPLKRSFNLYFVDFPGTNGVPYEKDRSFEELSSELALEITKLKEPVYVLGHSYGGLFAADLALRSDLVRGIACLATPFSKRIFESVGPRSESRRTPALTAATGRWQSNPCDQTFAEWLAEYGSIYFASATQAQGREMLLNDPVSARFFKANRSEANQMEPLLGKLTSWAGKKLYIAGEEDGLLDPSLAKADAEIAGFDFVLVSEASHFVGFDQSEQVMHSVEDAFIGRGRNR